MRSKFDVERYWPYVILASVTFFAFLPCLFADYLNWDDPSHFFGNPLVTAPGIRGLMDIFLHADSVASVYMPLTLFSFALELRIFGQSPFISHLINLLLHMSAAGLVLSLGRRMGLSVKAALLAALIFAVHPMRVESVAWVAERKDVLYGSLYLAALIFYWEYVKHSKSKAYMLAFLCAAASMLAKPQAVSLPLVLFLMDRMAHRRWAPAVLIDKAPFCLAVGLLAAMTAVTYHGVLGAATTQAWWVRIWSATFYVDKFFWPAGLSIIYPVPGMTEHIWSGVVLLAVLGAVFIFRRDRWWGFALLFYVVTIFFMWRHEFSGIAKGAIQERYMYIPCVGFTFFLGALWDKWRTKKAFEGMILAAILIAGLAGMTFHRCFIWQDSFTFWSEVLETDKDNTFALINRAACLVDDKKVRARYGMPEKAAYEMALLDLRKAVRRAPRDEDAWKDLSIVYRRLGRSRESMAAFDRYEQVRLLNDPDFRPGKE